MLSISQKIVTSVFSVNAWWFVINFSDRLTCFISDSHTPPIHGLDGGFNFHSVLYGLNFGATKPKSIFFSDDFNSFSAPTKLVPLSEKMMLMFPPREMNFVSDMMSESADKSPATSKCMERVVKHVNSTPYLLLLPWVDWVLLDVLTYMGLK